MTVGISCEGYHVGVFEPTILILLHSAIFCLDSFQTSAFIRSMVISAKTTLTFKLVILGGDIMLGMGINGGDIM